MLIYKTEVVNLKELIKKYLNLQNVVFIIFVSVTLIYYSFCFYKHKILLFQADNSLFLLALVIIIFWVMAFSIFLSLENRKLIKQNQKLVQELMIRNEKQFNEIATSQKELMIRNEEQFHEIIMVNRNNKSIMLDIVGSLNG